jgi:beta-glucosidase/6-phospho-beta-glucosidase/beta-galactosidase
MVKWIHVSFAKLAKLHNEVNVRFREKFGLYQVDFTDPNRTRTIKSSAKFYKNVIATKCLVDTCEE